MIGNQKFFSEIFSPQDYLNNNIAIFGRRDTGKTVFLLSYFWKIYFQSKKKIIIFDSATYHIEKSLIRKICEKCDDYLLVNSPDENLLMNYNDYRKNHFSYCANQVYPHLEIKNNKNRVLLFDVSKYLEDSYNTNDIEERKVIRERYKNFVAQSLLVLHDICEEYIILMDEIEFNRNITRMIDMENKRGNFVINTIHDVDYICEYPKISIVNADQLLLRTNDLLFKSEFQPCGNACCEIVGALFYLKECRVKEPLFWCTDLAYALAFIIGNIQVLCWKSSLYEDYKESTNMSFAGFQSIRNFELKFGNIAEKPLSASILMSEISASRCVIYCVQSALFHGNPELSNGHYIVIYREGATVYCLNPQRTVITREFQDLDKIVRCCISFGGWRILCQ